MSKVRNLAKVSLQRRVSDEEWAARLDLAACYRLAVHFGMTDLIYTHISARVPGPEHHFLINAFGLLWDEISASTLVKVTLDGEVVEDPTGSGINRAGYVIHSAVHRARPDVGCVMHTHTQAGIAVSAQEDGLLPLSQHAMRFSNSIAYHDYEGLALDLDEQVRLVSDLGDRPAMILRNHGLLVCGESVAQTFDLMYYLERACRTQVSARRRPRVSSRDCPIRRRKRNGRRCCACSTRPIHPIKTERRNEAVPERNSHEHWRQ
jgi:ribulose-5-phosphate 4-epimerase/fuculose-1-phosphate aldolase